MDVYIKLKDFYWRYRWLGITSVLCMAMAVAVGYARPILLKQIIDGVIIGGHREQLPYLALAVLCAALVRAIFIYGKSYIGHLFGASAVCDLRNALYAKLQAMPFSYYDKARTGDLMSRLAGDVEVFRQFLAFGIADLVDFILMFAFGIILMLSLNWRLTLVTLVTAPALIFTVVRFSDRVHKAFSKVRRSASQVNSTVQENITGMRTVKSFARERQQQEVFEACNEAYKESQLGAARLWATYFPLMEFLSNLCIVMLLWFGSRQVHAHTLSIGGFVAFFNLIWYIVGPIQQLGFRINMLTQAIAGGERIVEILFHPARVPDGHITVDAGAMAGHVVFQDVSFSYETGEPVLSGITIDARPGTVIGITGPTGSGKSTLASLIYRGYDVTGGTIKIDGIDVRDMTLPSLRRTVASVFQDTFLFSTTIRENIRYARRDASDAEVEEASELAQAHGFIAELPLGYETLVGERGLGLSGGQKQRIAIARAILANPRILVFDDATASVDMETEVAIQRGLALAGQGRTVFVIAHRISSLKNADHIVVLDRGRIVEQGTHLALLNQGGQYSRIYEVQYSGLDTNARSAV